MSQSEAGAPSSGGSEGGSAPLPPAKPGSRLDTSENFPNQSGARALSQHRTVTQFRMFGGWQLEWVPFGPGECRWVPGADLVETYNQDGDPTGLAVASSSPRPEELEDAGQKPFRFSTHGVQMAFEPWRRAVAANLELHARAMGTATKTGRSARRVARDLAECGTWAERATCTSCGVEETHLVTICNAKVCQYCAYVKAAGKRKALEEKLAELAKDRPVHVHPGGRVERYRPYFITWTKRWKPEDANSFHGDAFRSELKSLKDVVKKTFRYVLSRDSSGRKLAHAGLHWEVEVPFGGGTHVHALYWGLRVDLVAARQEIAAELEDGGNIDVREVYDKVRGKKTKRGPIEMRAAIKECCKYLTKGSSPTRSIGRFAEKETSARMDPALAAIVEIAFRSVPLTGGYGTLKSIKNRGEELEPTAFADACGGCARIDATAPVYGPHEPGTTATIERRFVHRTFVRAGDLSGVVKMPVPGDRRRTKEREAQLASYVGALELRNMSDPNAPPRDFTSKPPPNAKGPP